MKSNSIPNSVNFKFKPVIRISFSFYLVPFYSSVGVGDCSRRARLLKRN